jgi:hypothetical protein
MPMLTEQYGPRVVRLANSVKHTEAPPVAAHEPRYTYASMARLLCRGGTRNLCCVRRVAAGRDVGAAALVRPSAGTAARPGDSGTADLLAFLMPNVATVAGLIGGRSIPRTFTLDHACSLLISRRQDANLLPWARALFCCLAHDAGFTRLSPSGKNLTQRPDAN